MPDVGKNPLLLRTLVSSLSAPGAKTESELCFLHHAETDVGTFIRLAVSIPVAAATRSSRAGPK